MLKKLLNNHSSFLVLAISSLSIFIVNILLKKILDINEYGLYSLFITYISILASFGLMGTDQTFIRVSTSQNNNIFTDINLKKYIFFIIFTFSIPYTLIFWSLYLINYSFFLILIITISSLTTLFVYNILRLKMYFLLSQIINNLWKILPTIILLMLCLFKIKIDFQKVINIFSFIFFIILIINILIIRKTNFENKKTEINLFDMSLQNLISNFTIVVINFFDRIIIEKNLGIIELANYFFLSNIFLFPFLLFQNYIGFKEIIKFKSNFSIEIMKNKILSVLKFSLLFSVLLFISSIILDRFGIFNLDITGNIKLIIIMIIIGITKNIYSIVSAAGGAITNPQMTKNLNIISFFSLLLLTIPYNYKFNIELTISFFLLIWVIRIISIIIIVRRTYNHSIS
jgi:O-antigen/teichoic acid export membrane protein